MKDSGNILTQFASRVPAVPGRSDEEDAPPFGTDDFGSFGCLRGVSERAVMLEFRFRDGRIIAFGNAFLERVEFDPAKGITLTFAGRPVTIRGQNLNAEVRPNVSLINAICRHRVPWIRESDEPAAILAGRNGVVIEQIDVT